MLRLIAIAATAVFGPAWIAIPITFLLVFGILDPENWGELSPHPASLPPNDETDETEENEK